MATVGVRMTASNLTVDGVTYNGVVDLDKIFHPRGTATPAANTGIRGSGNDDMSSFFYPLSAGGSQLPDATGLHKGGVDLRSIFAAKGTVSSGGGDGGGGCLPYDTPVPLWAGGTRALGDLWPGDIVIGYFAPGMMDESVANWQDWRMPSDAATEGHVIPVMVKTSMVGEYPWHYLINDQQPATYEHRFLVLRDGAWTWRRAEQLQVGDAFLDWDLQPAAIESIARIDAPTQMANIDVEEVDNFFFQSFNGRCLLSHNPGDKS